MSDVASRFGGGTAEPDPLQRFLQRVVAWSLADPPESFVNIHALGGNTVRPFRGGGRSFAGPSGLWDAVEFVRYLNHIEAQVFFCISAQSDYDRERSKQNRVALRRGIKARWLKSFVLDLDVKPGRYPSQRAALAAALPFLDGLGLKHGPIVSSGGGLHVYVTLDQPISPEKWRPLAAKLAGAAVTAGLHFDRQCTVNSACLWRMPTSIHRKDPNNPRECRVLGWGVDLKVNEVEAALADVPTTGGYAAANVNVRNGVDLSFLPPRPPITGPEADRARADMERSREATSFDLLRTTCGVVADSERRRGDGDLEPLWFELGKLMRFVQHGREWFHHLSDGDARYDREQTDAKYDGATSAGWPRCATIAASSEAASAICQRCPYLSLNQTPIHHASGRAVSPPHTAVTPGNGHVNGHAGSASAFTSGIPYDPIWLPPNYRYDHPTGMIFTPEGLQVFNTPVTDISQVDVAEGKSFRRKLRWTTRRPTADTFVDNEFDISTGVLASRQKFAEAVAEWGLDCCKQTKGCPDPVGDRFVPDLLTLIREKKLSTTQVRQGWVERDGVITGFAFGGRLFTPDGTRPIGVVENDDYTPCGLLPAWREAANAYVGKGCTAMEVIIAASLAAPLVRFTGVKGLVVFTYSANTGKGKSAALYAGATVWARSKSVLTGGSEKGTMSKMYAANNLPFCFDELIPDGQLAKQFGGIVKAVTAGVEDAKQYRNMTDRPQRTSRTLLNANSNKSLVEVTRGDTNANAARVFEFEMPDDAAKVRYTASQTASFRDALEQNYGVGGMVVAEYLGKNHARVKQVMDMVGDEFQRELGYTDAERFWLAFVTADYVGAYIGKATGLFDFNLPAIKRFLLEQFRQQRSAVSDTGTNADDPEVQFARVGEFLNEHTDRRLVTQTMPRGSSQTPPMNGFAIRGPAVYRWAKEDKKIWISEPRLRSWCSKAKGYSYDHMKKVLQKYDYWDRKRDGRRLGAGCTAAYWTEAEVVLEINLADPKIASLSPPEDEPTGETNAV